MHPGSKASCVIVMLPHAPRYLKAACMHSQWLHTCRRAVLPWRAALGRKTTIQQVRSTVSAPTTLALLATMPLTSRVPGGSSCRKRRQTWGLALLRQNAQCFLHLHGLQRWVRNAVRL